MPPTIISKTPIKIGFVGVGSMGQCAHLRNYASPSLSKECEVVAIAEIRPNLARDVAARYGVPRVYENHEQLLANEKLDAIVASQPFTRHGLLVPELAKAGIPIFTEKPIAGSIKAGEKILRALEESKTWLMLGYHKRSDPATEYAKQVIEEWKRTGEFGKMEAFVNRMIKDNGVNASVVATTDRREALKDADYVVVMIPAGGVEEFRQDYEIPLKYGVDQCIGDTMGPGGVFRALAGAQEH